MRSSTHDPACECENVKHFEFDGEQGGSIHAFGDAPGNVKMKTNYGTFRVCQQCAHTCLKGLAEVEK